jgi:hypothetical protein
MLVPSDRVATTWKPSATTITITIIMIMVTATITIK